MFSTRDKPSTGRHRADQHRHGMGVVAETLHELLGGFVQHGVMRDLVDPSPSARCAGQFAKQQQIGNLKISAVLGQHFDGIAAIAQDAFVAVNKGDRAAADAVFMNAGS